MSCRLAWSDNGQEKSPINLSLTENQDAVRIVFRDRVRDSYDLFVYWNDSLLKGAPFKLEPPKPTARLI